MYLDRLWQTTSFIFRDARVSSTWRNSGCFIGEKIKEKHARKVTMMRSDVPRWANLPRKNISLMCFAGLFKLQDLVKSPPSVRTEMYIRQAGPKSYRQVLREIRHKEIFKLIVDTDPAHMQQFFRAVSSERHFYNCRRCSWCLNVCRNIFSFRTLEIFATPMFFCFVHNWPFLFHHPKNTTARKPDASVAYQFFYFFSTPLNLSHDKPDKLFYPSRYRMYNIFFDTM